jgi:hypothetical protein
MVSTQDELLSFPLNIKESLRCGNLYDKKNLNRNSVLENRGMEMKRDTEVRPLLFAFRISLSSIKTYNMGFEILITVVCRVVSSGI